MQVLGTRVLCGVIFAFGAGLLASVCLLRTHTANIGFTLQSSPAGFCRAGYSFFMGVLLYRIFAVRIAAGATHVRRDSVLPLMLVAAVAALLLPSVPPSFTAAYDSLAVIVLFPVIVFMAVHVEPPREVARIFGFLGGISYAVYALHAPLFHAIEGAAAKYGVNLGTASPWLGWLFIAGVVGIATAVDKVYDTPVRQKLISVIETRDRSWPSLRKVVLARR